VPYWKLLCAREISEEMKLKIFALETALCQLLALPVCAWPKLFPKFLPLFPFIPSTDNVPPVSKQLPTLRMPFLVDRLKLGLVEVSRVCLSIQCKSFFSVRYGMACLLFFSVQLKSGKKFPSFIPRKSIKAPDVDWDQMQVNKEAMECLIPMGVTSENVVEEYGLDRKTLDAFSAKSHQKAAAAQQQGKFVEEIVPVAGVSKDDGIRPSTTPAVLSKLKPVFKANGVTTAGNSSQTTDGAAAVLLMTRAQAEKRGLPILGVWRGFAVKGVPPRIMGIGPAVAIPAVLEQTGLTINDIDIFEINEAFASQATWSVDELKIDPEKVNPNGGAIAIGHPLGCTGARQIATLLHEMKRTKKRFGVVSMCIGTGMGAAAVIEAEPRSSL
jgi:acetyl-CoA acyltransferase 1